LVYEDTFGKRYNTPGWMRYALADFPGLRMPKAIHQNDEPFNLCSSIESRVSSPPGWDERGGFPNRNSSDRMEIDSTELIVCSSVYDRTAA